MEFQVLYWLTNYEIKNIVLRSIQPTGRILTCVCRLLNDDVKRKYKDNFSVKLF